jgi:hypothetical protein
MELDPNIVFLVATTCGVGYLMMLAGLQKSLLELKRRRRICPSCGRQIQARTCACST